MNVQSAWLSLHHLFYVSNTGLVRFDHEVRWSETGDRYIIKLFRDYVFHQVDEKGHPVMDLGHVLTCLNKVSLLQT